jgi:hypothetical protein
MGCTMVKRMVKSDLMAGDPHSSNNNLWFNKPIGRPSNYKPEFCQRAVELGAKGYSKAMIIADIGAGSYETVDSWINAVPAFLEAMQRARALALAYWEWMGLENAGNRDFNSNLYRIVMMARFGVDGYREKQIVEHIQGESGVDLSLLSPEEREKLAVLLEKAKTEAAPDSKPAPLAGSVH